MPNHVTCVLTVSGDDEQISSLLGICIVNNRFDFNAVIPMPECAKDVESSNVAQLGFYALTGLALAQYTFQSHPANHAIALGLKIDRVDVRSAVLKWIEAEHPDWLESGRKMLQCFRETGYMSWYDWSCDKWGTKWNSYDYKLRTREPGSAVIEFQTAWDVARPVLRELSDTWPELRFDLEAVNEGGPEYVGTYQAGKEEFSKVDPDRERHKRVRGHYPDEDESE